MTDQKQTKRIVRQFEALWRRSARRELSALADYDDQSWLAEALTHLKAIAADVPPVKEMAPAFRASTEGAVNVMAILKLLQQHGLPFDKARVVSDAIMQREIDRVPAWVRRLSGWFLFTKMAQNMTGRYAKQGANAGPDDYKMDYVPGDGGTFGINITQCAVCRLAQKHDMRDMMPAICGVDSLLSDAMGWGLRRTETIASGAKRCDFVFRKGAATDVRV